MSTTTVFDLDNCFQLTDVAITKIGQGCPQLKNIYLVYCDQVTNFSIKELLKGCPRLQTLNLPYGIVIDI